MTEPLLDRLQEVASEIGAASHFLLCLDFDGTLAPIVPDPADAHIPGETRAVLEQLTSRPGVTVAVVSGRSVRDLQMRVGLNIILAGNHGLEMIEGNTRWRHPAAARWEPVLHKICDELVARAGQIPGALIEDKGRTAGFHYRNMASAEVPLISEILNTVVAPHDDFFSCERAGRFSRSCRGRGGTKAQPSCGFWNICVKHRAAKLPSATSVTIRPMNAPSTNCLAR